MARLGSHRTWRVQRWHSHSHNLDPPSKGGPTVPIALGGSDNDNIKGYAKLKGMPSRGTTWHIFLNLM
jgi:hypothetical protein